MRSTLALFIVLLTAIPCIAFPVLPCPQDFYDANAKAFVTARDAKAPPVPPGHTLVLDFDGDSGNWGGTIPAFQVPSAIPSIVALVSQAYAPYSVTVTTTDPGTYPDGSVGKIVIGGDGAWTGQNTSGLTYIGGFTNPNTSNVGYSFPLAFGNNTQNVAQSIVHEAGHLFGLQHHSDYDAQGIKTAEYAAGDGINGAFMGFFPAYDFAHTHWITGPSSLGANVIQNDDAVLAGVLGRATVTPEPSTWLWWLGVPAIAIQTRTKRARWRRSRHCSSPVPMQPF